MRFLATGLLAVFMLMQSLIPRVATDLLHSPEVWKHYKEHQQQQQSPVSFLDFLLMHFSADSEHTKQKQHHLPSFDFNSVAGFFVLPTACISYIPCIETIVYTKTNFSWTNLYSFQSVAVLICPPRA